jgi:hypothetical protein
MLVVATIYHHLPVGFIPRLPGVSHPASIPINRYRCGGLLRPDVDEEGIPVGIKAPLEHSVRIVIGESRARKTGDCRYRKNDRFHGQSLRIEPGSEDGRKLPPDSP